MPKRLGLRQVGTCQPKQIIKIIDTAFIIQHAVAFYVLLTVCHLFVYERHILYYSKQTINVLPGQNDRRKKTKTQCKHILPMFYLAYSHIVVTNITCDIIDYKNINLILRSTVE